MDIKIHQIENFDNQNGKLMVVLKKSDFGGKNLNFGQLYWITFAKKGVVRANHYHKSWRVWFLAVKGKIQVELEDIKTKKHSTVILASSDKKPQLLEVGPYVAHAFVSLTKNACLIEYSNRQYKKNQVICYPLIEPDHQNL